MCAINIFTIDGKVIIYLYILGGYVVLSDFLLITREEEIACVGEGGENILKRVAYITRWRSKRV